MALGTAAVGTATLPARGDHVHPIPTLTGDAGSVEQHSLKDQIEAERFLASKEAMKRPGLGIRLTKLMPDGTT